MSHKLWGLKRPDGTMTQVVENEWYDRASGVLRTMTRAAVWHERVKAEREAFNRGGFETVVRVKVVEA